MALLFLAKVIGGDWPKAKVAEIRTTLSGKPKSITLRKGFLRKDRLPVKEVATVEIVTQQNETSAGGKVAWGTAGALALGPVGLLAGAMIGGNHNLTTLLVRFKDGRAALLQGESKVMMPLYGLTVGGAKGI